MGMKPRQAKRRSSIIEFGTGPARVKIYTMTRGDGCLEFTLAWKEGGVDDINRFPRAPCVSAFR